MLLSVVIESSRMAGNARRLSKRDAINVWDKMSVPVQGGQFKVAADGAARETANYFGLLTDPGSEKLQAKAKEYRKANVAYQTQGSKFLSSTIRGETGGDIVSEPVITAYPDLVHATFMLWQEILEYLNNNLQKQRTETISAATLAGFVGALVILAAFGIAVALSRALADRTQQEIEDLGFMILDGPAEPTSSPQEDSGFKRDGTGATRWLDCFRFATIQEDQRPVWRPQR